MLYENYRENVVYSSQSTINFPRSGPGGKVGFGSAVFLMCPNRDKSLEVIKDPIMNLIPSATKRLVTDTIYKEKIGFNRIVSLERANTDRFYLKQEDFPLTYITSAAKPSVLNKHVNVVNDLSRWMEIFFARIDNLSAKKVCAEFIRILKDRMYWQNVMEQIQN